jgi:hypothetical protein
MKLSNRRDDFEVKRDLIHPRCDTTLPFYDEAATRGGLLSNLCRPHFRLA